MALLAATIGFFLFGGTDSARFEPITACRRPRLPGAQVTPTEPKLRVEPKWTPSFPRISLPCAQTSR
jgi:hypothetical protein